MPVDWRRNSEASNSVMMAAVLMNHPALQTFSSNQILSKITMSYPRKQPVSIIKSCLWGFDVLFYKLGLFNLPVTVYVHIVEGI